MRIVGGLFGLLGIRDGHTHYAPLGGVLECGVPEGRAYSRAGHWSAVTCPACLSSPRYEETCHKCGHEQSHHTDGTGRCGVTGIGKFMDKHWDRVPMTWWCGCKGYVAMPAPPWRVLEIKHKRLLRP